jgi:signal transduction histidine kinase
MKLRVRIALTLAACLIIAGAVVLGVSAFTYQQAVYRTPIQQADQMWKRLGTTRAGALAYLREHPEAAIDYDSDAPTANGLSVNEAFQQTQRADQRAAVRSAWTWSALSLGVMAVAAALIGWLIAGRTLRPLRSITARARAASAMDLSSRVALEDPNDEVQELGDTFDEMLDRLECAFVAQRRFSAQVSHEVRTPLAIISSEADILLRDARPSDRHSLEQIRDATNRAERIIAALLVLSRSGSGDIIPEDLDLDRVTGDVLGEVVNGPEWRDVRVELDLEPAPVRADPALLERVVANLLSNSIRHNRPGGWVEVRTWRDGEWSVLEVANSTGATGGDPLDAAPTSTSTPRNGIGLTVVDSVLAAHGGHMTWERETPGATTIQVRLPVPAERIIVRPLASPHGSNAR